MRFLPSTLMIAIMALFFATSTVSPAQAGILGDRIFFQFNSKQVAPSKAQKGVLGGWLKEKRINGTVLWVKKPKSGKPTVLYFHGSRGNLASRAWKFKWFAHQGYGVVAVGYPGSSGSRGKPSFKAITAQAKMVYDALPKLVGKSDVILYGESLGTGVAVQLASDLKARGVKPAGIVLESPFTSMLELIKVQSPLHYPFYAKRKELWPSAAQIRRLDVPLFVMHGKKDDLVPVWMGKKLFHQSPSSQKQLRVHRDADHGSIYASKGTRKRLRLWIAGLK